MASSSTTTSPQGPCKECSDDAVIVGGGIAGLAVAAALQNISGIRHLHILEQSSQDEYQDECQGAALILGPNALRAVKAIGGQACLGEILSQGSHIRGNVMLPPNATTTTLITADYSDSMTKGTTMETTGLPQVLIRWGVLRRILKQLLKDTVVHVSTRVQATNYRGIVEDDNRIQVLNSSGVIVPLPNTNTNSSNNTTSLLIAADGIDSRFAKLLHPFNNLKDNGRLNIKAVVKKQLPNHMIGITYSYFENNIACFAGPAGNEFTYWAISIPNDASNHAYHSDTDLNVLKDDLIQQLSSIHVPFFIVELIQVTPASRIFARQSQESLHVSQLYSSSDNVVLVGDAAHAISPSYGQGGSMALEDAVTLATCIKHHSLLQVALEEYSQARTSRSETMVNKSAQRTKLAVKGEPIEDVSQWIFQWEPPPL